MFRATDASAPFGEFNTTVEDIYGLTDAVRDLDMDSSAWNAFFGWRLNRYLARFVPARRQQI